MHLLVTGGAGYIGSHTVYELLKAGHKVTILDNLSNSDTGVLDVIADNVGAFDFIQADLRDYHNLLNEISGNKYDACIHFAALIEVGRSVLEPEAFFDNNVMGSHNLIKALTEIGVDKMIFSSTAAVYGTPETTPIPETARINTENPYGTSKFIVEKFLQDYAQFKGLNSIALRYFNPAGSLNGVIGENHKNESHVIPRLLRSFTKPNKYQFKVFGTDYPTPDGTAVRDYIHIMDLVDAHIKAVAYLENHKGFDVFNVGTGKGSSVNEVIAAAEAVTGKELEYEIAPRRSGDSPVLVAAVDKIKEKMGWEAKFGLKEIVESAWDWEKKSL
jgi:UDP-glucose 4-epimerase